MKGILSIITLIFVIDNVKAQGLIFDSTGFSKREKLEETRTELPLSVSLKKYTPIVYPQINNSCVAHSFAVARTILYAEYLKSTDKMEITRLSFSPYFIYYRNKDVGDLSCKSGLNIETTARDAITNGIAPLTDVEYPDYYPFTEKALCIEDQGISYPPTMANDLVSAQKFKIDVIYRVTSIAELKTALSAGMPTILCFYVPESFNNVKGDLWTPQITDKIDKRKGHALIAIGYDETKYGGAIELMNSWGVTWGNKGFTWVKYKDYIKWFLGGYALYVDNGMKLKGTNNPEFKPEGAKIGKKIMKLNINDGKNKIKFDNSEFIKSFQSFDNKLTNN